MKQCKMQQASSLFVPVKNQAGEARLTIYGRLNLEPTEKVVEMVFNI